MARWLEHAHTPGRKRLPFEPDISTEKGKRNRKELEKQKQFIAEATEREMVPEIKSHVGKNGPWQEACVRTQGCLTETNRIVIYFHCLTRDSGELWATPPPAPRVLGPTRSAEPQAVTGR